MKAKKLLAVCLTGSMIAACAAGCGSSSGGVGKGSGKENITIRVLATGTDYSDIIIPYLKEKGVR